MVGSNQTHNFIIIESDTSSTKIVLAALLLILGATLLVAAIRHFKYQKQCDQIEADIRLKKRQEYNKGDVEVSTKPSAYNKVANSSVAKFHDDDLAAEYESQYKPAYFSVFGLTPQQKSLKLEIDEKVNKADEVNSPAANSPAGSVNMLISTQTNMISHGALSRWQH